MTALASVGAASRAAVTGALLVLVVGCGAPGTDTPSSSRTTAPAVTTAPVDGTTTSPPVRLMIPAIGGDSDLM